ncbi:MAG: HAMP domain-containing protein [Pelotomaculum sp.]|nr:HAMP domain-containing protein [Pelotomaculum sp.]
MGKSLFSKLMVSYLVITLVTLAAVGIAMSQLFANYFYFSKERELKRKGQEMARFIAGYLEKDQSQRFDSMLYTLGIFLDARLTAINREALEQGYYGMRITPQMWLTAEEAGQVLEGKTVSKRGFNPRHGQAMLTVVVPVQANSEVAGALILSSPISDLAATVNAVRLLILYAAAAAVVLSVLLGFWLSRSISRPLSQMSAVTREMARGNFRQRVEVTSDDEVGRLAEDFNYLAASLDQTVSALSHEKGKIENILANMTEGVLAVDGRGQVILANGAISRTLKVDPAELLGQPLSELSCCPGLAGLFSAVAGSGEPGSAEFEMDGGRTFVLVHLAPLREAGGSYGAVGVLQDITELRKLELLRRDFVANVSHELRTPLTSIQGFLEALMDGTIGESQARERYLKVIHQETLRLNRLINELLDLAQIESGKVRWEINPIDVPSLVGRVILKLKPQIERYQITVVPEMPEGLPLMLGNEDRIEQVLTNLLENAVRYSPPGSTVTVRAAGREGKITVEVADRGPGIPPEDLPHIWERFHRVEKSRSRSLGGTGLGLAIVRQIIEAHGGQVDVQSEAGQGSVFSFTLAAAPGES